jgi:manganese/zinc/iron transport system permease protein
MIASDVKLIGAVTAAGLVIVFLLYKEFRLVTFDAAFARVQGWPASLLDFLIMLLVSVMVVVALPAAGVVLTAALLILPAVAARFWTEWLGAMLMLSALFGAVIGVAGTLVSASGGMPTGPMIVLAGAVVFVTAMFFAPRRGIAARTIAARRATRDLEQQKLLRAVYESSEPRLPQTGVSISSLAERMSFAPRRLHSVLRRARRGGLVTMNADRTVCFTDQGMQRAASIIRADRLWRMFLTEYPDSASLFSNLDVEQIDRLLPRELVAELELLGRTGGKRMMRPLGVP